MFSNTPRSLDKDVRIDFNAPSSLLVWQRSKEAVVMVLRLLLPGLILAQLAFGVAAHGLAADQIDPAIWRPNCAPAEVPSSSLPSLAELAMALAQDGDPARRCPAFTALEARAAGGDNDAALLAGDLLVAGTVVAPDAARAEAFYLAAFDAGDPRAALRLGDLYRSPAAGSAQLASSVAYYEDARLMGDPLASARLGDYFASIGDGERAFTNYQAAADSGYAAAYLSLGKLFSEGQLLPADQPAALAAFHKALDQGERAAPAAIANTLIGSGDVAGARSVLEAAAASGNTEATIALGDLFRDGAGLPLDRAKAAEAYHAAADAGDAVALLRLGDLQASAGSDTDIKAAAESYGKALATGDAEAGLRLGDLYRDHPSVAPGDAAVTAYQRAFALGANEAAARLGALMLVAGSSDRYARAAPYFAFAPQSVPREDALGVADAIRDGALASERSKAMVDIYEQSLDAGETAAAVRLGDLYFEGRLLQRDIGKAEHFYLLGGATLPPETLATMGDARRDGTGIAVDLDKAADYYRRALDAGLADAGMRLGELLATTSEGAPERVEEAVTTFIRTAETGQPRGLLLAADTVRARDPNRAIELYQRALDAGIAEAAAKLGDIYFSGEAGKPDLPLAATFYDKSPDGTPDDALLPLARLFQADEPRRAASLYERALALGKSEAAGPLGDLQLSGALGVSDPQQAEAYFAMVPEGASPQAMIALGDAYRDGAGVAADIQRAIAYYERAAGGGMVEASERLGDLYFDGVHLPADPQKAAGYYERGPAVPNKALLAIADLYRDGAFGTRGGEAAARYYRAALDANLPGAAQRLGDLYLAGAVIARDVGLATDFYEQSDGGIPGTALIAVADHFRDLGGPANVERAVGYYKRALGNGDLNAAGRLGDVYLSGRGVAVNVAEAERYYRLSPAGVPDPERLVLGDAYRDGNGVAADGRKARDYYIAALETDRQQAAQRLGDLLLEGKLLPRNLGTAAGYYDQVTTIPPDILRALGEAFLAGDGADVDVPRGIAYLERAANTGDRTALRRLGDIFSNGKEAPLDLPKAEQYYLQSATAGDPDALLQLAAGYLDGRFSGSPPERGVSLLRQAVESGIGAATPLLADALISGRGVARDVPAAAAVLEAAAAAGDIDSGLRLLWLYRKGADDFARQPRAAQRVLDMLAPRLAPQDALVEQTLISIGPAGLPASTEKMTESFLALESGRRADLLLQVRSLNENVYVFLLQQELRKRGQFDEPATGQLTKATIRQMRALCASLDKAETCSAGPMSEQSTKVITDALR